MTTTLYHYSKLIWEAQSAYSFCQAQLQLQLRLQLKLRLALLSLAPATHQTPPTPIKVYLTLQTQSIKSIKNCVDFIKASSRLQLNVKPELGTTPAPALISSLLCPKFVCFWNKDSFREHIWGSISLNLYPHPRFNPRIILREKKFLTPKFSAPKILFCLKNLWVKNRLDQFFHTKISFEQQVY